VGRDHLEVGGRKSVEWALSKEGMRVWIWFVWLRIVFTGGLLWTHQWTFRFH